MKIVEKHKSFNLIPSCRIFLVPYFSVIFFTGQEMTNIESF